MLMRICFTQSTPKMGFGATGTTPPVPRGGVLRLPLPHGSQAWYYAYPIELETHQVERLAAIYPGREFNEKLIYVALPVTTAGKYDAERRPKILTSQTTIRDLAELEQYNPPAEGRRPLIRQLAVSLFAETGLSNTLSARQIGDAASHVWYDFYVTAAVS